MHEHIQMHSPAPEPAVPRRRPRHRWVVPLVAAALVAVFVLAWPWLRLSDLERYVSTPIDASGTRVSVLAPRGWRGAGTRISVLAPSGWHAQLDYDSWKRTAAPGVEPNYDRYHVFSEPSPPAPRAWWWLRERLGFHQVPLPVISSVIVRVTAGGQPPASLDAVKESVRSEPDEWSSRGLRWIAVRRRVDHGVYLEVTYHTDNKAQFDRTHAAVTASARLVPGSAAARAR